MKPPIAIFILVAALNASGQDQEPTVSQLRETISKLVDVQTLESEERLTWQSRRAELAALLELHRKELELLDQELEQAGQSAPAHDDHVTALETDIEALKQVRQLASEAVVRNVPRVVALAKRFPAPLKSEVETELASLAAWRSSDEPRDALRSILTLLAKAEQFNRRLTRITEIREGREVQVLYLGLAQAFYAGKKQASGIGSPGPDGWTWKSNEEIRQELITAFDSLDKKRPPSMVTLPLEIR